MEKIANELVKIAKELVGAFVDQPVPWDSETEDKLEKEVNEAEAKLKRELREVKGRYYWEPGHTLSINITLTGIPIFEDYRIGGLLGPAYRNGILVINPQWVPMKHEFNSYSWAPLADKMIQACKQSKKIPEMVNEFLDRIEGKLNIKITPDIRRDIIRWCEKAAERRLSVPSFPGPKGKEFVIVPQVSEPVI